MPTACVDGLRRVLASAADSVGYFAQACRSRAVLQTCAWFVPPAAIACVLAWLLIQMLGLPLRLATLLVTLLAPDSAASSILDAADDRIDVVAAAAAESLPLLQLALLRNLFGGVLDRQFLAAVAELGQAGSPGGVEAASIAGVDRTVRFRTAASRLHRSLLAAQPAGLLSQLQSSVGRLCKLVCLQTLLSAASLLPFGLNRILLGVIHWVYLQKGFGRVPAAVICLAMATRLSAVCSPGLALWMTSRALARELLAPMTGRLYQDARARSLLYRRHDLEMVGFSLPLILCAKAPFVGPLVFLAGVSSAAGLAVAMYLDPDPGRFKRTNSDQDDTEGDPRG